MLLTTPVIYGTQFQRFGVAYAAVHLMFGGHLQTFQALNQAMVDQPPTLAARGDAAITLGALTSAATGTVDVHGSASITLDPATVAAIGAVAVNGSLTATLGVLALSSSGVVAVAGSLSATLGMAAVSSTVTVATAGSGPHLGAIVSSRVVSLVANRTVTSLSPLRRGAQ